MILFTAILLIIIPADDSFYLSRLKYNGGDWYNDPSALFNLAVYFNDEFGMNIDTEQKIVDIDQACVMKVPFLFITGHGEIIFTEEERRIFREYVENGGFVYIDDDYGFNNHVRKEIELIFPDFSLQPISRSHIIYHWPFDFPEGLPKIHHHDGYPPEGWGIEIDGRMSVFYTYESNISDGWADRDVHGDPEKVRETAFKMGVNIISYSMVH